MCCIEFIPSPFQTFILIVLLSAPLVAHPVMGVEYVPRKETTEYVDRTVAARLQGNNGGGGGSVFKPFRQCGDCTCCASHDRSSCVKMPCCYGINCNLPGKPFGTCALVPLACNCTGCS